MPSFIWLALLGAVELCAKYIQKITLSNNSTANFIHKVDVCLGTVDVYHTIAVQIYYEE